MAAFACADSQFQIPHVQAKRKYQEVLAVKQQLDGDNQELQQKYSQKAM